jgi:hypothetical protein
MPRLTDLLRRIQTDHAFYRQFLTNPEEAMQDYDLTAPQREALLARDIRLYHALLNWASASSRTRRPEGSAVLQDDEDAEKLLPVDEDLFPVEEEGSPDLALHPSLDQSPNLHLEPNFPPPLSESPPPGISLSLQLPPSIPTVTIGPLGGPGPEPTLGPGPPPEPQFPPSPQPPAQPSSRFELEHVNRIRELVRQVKAAEPPGRIEVVVRLMEQL